MHSYPSLSTFYKNKDHSQSEHRINAPRCDTLCSILDSHKPKARLDAPGQCKQRLVKPLQTSRKLRVLNELDLMVPDKDSLFLTQAYDRENNPNFEKLMEQVKNITNFSKHASKRWTKKTCKTTNQNPNEKQDLLQQNLRKEIYQKIEQGRKKAYIREVSQSEKDNMYAERAMTEERTNSVEGIRNSEENEDMDTIMRQSSEISLRKVGMKQLKNNVHFRYTNRKLLLLRSLDALPSNEKIVKAFLKKTGKGGIEIDAKVKQGQQICENTKLIIKKKKELNEFQQNLKSHKTLIKTERTAKRRGSAPFFLAQNKPSRLARRDMKYSCENNTLDVPNTFSSTLQHLDDIPNSIKLDSIYNDDEFKEVRSIMDLPEHGGASFAKKHINSYVFEEKQRGATLQATKMSLDFIHLLPQFWIPEIFEHFSF